MPTTNVENQLDADGLSPLKRQFRSELVQIIRGSQHDLEGALAALDRYLAQDPPPDFQKSLLSWKGRFYVEHKRYDDAVRVLRIADGLHVPGDIDLENYNVKFDLSTALEERGDPQEAYVVLTALLNEIEAPSLMGVLLPHLVRVSSRLGQPMPPRSEEALRLMKQFYGLDHPPEADLREEAVRLDELVRADSVRFSRLHLALGEVENTAKRIRMVEKYLKRVRVPYYKREADGLLQQIREGKR
jgi:tetratricopeptide (TPR) repeat protein